MVEVVEGTWLNKIMVAMTDDTIIMAIEEEEAITTVITEAVDAITNGDTKEDTALPPNRCAPLTTLPWDPADITIPCLLWLVASVLVLTLVVP